MNSLTINEKVGKIIPGKTKRNEVIEVFGEPDGYAWGEERFTEEELADRVSQGLAYVMFHDDMGIHFLCSETVGEVRIENNSDYRYENEIGLGASVDQVISYFGEPDEIVEGESVDWHRSKVLYKEIDGEPGRNYIHYMDVGVRMFFIDDQVVAFYIREPGTTP